MKLVDLKIPKKTKKELEADKPMPADEPGDQYPWGMQLRFEEREIEKVAGLKTANAGDMVRIEAVAKVREVRTVDRTDSAKRQTVELQIQKIAVAPRETGKPGTSAKLNEILDE